MTGGETARRPKKHPLSEYIAAVSLLVILPAITAFGLSYIQDLYAEDIFYGSLSTAAGYTAAVLNALLPYAAFGVTVGCVLYYGARNSIPFIILSYVSLLMPYAGGFFVGYMLSPLVRANLTYYLAYTALNYLAIDAVIMTLVLLASLYAVKRARRKKPVNAKQKKAAKPFDALKFSAIASVAVYMVFELCERIYSTAVFIYELKYEYYASPTLNELIAVASDYVTIAAKAAAGFAVILLLASVFKRNSQKIDTVEAADKNQING